VKVIIEHCGDTSEVVEVARDYTYVQGEMKERKEGEWSSKEIEGCPLTPSFPTPITYFHHLLSLLIIIAHSHHLLSSPTPIAHSHCPLLSPAPIAHSHYPLSLLTPISHSQFIFVVVYSELFFLYFTYIYSKPFVVSILLLPIYCIFTNDI
jgi:hypothetical protein